MSKKMPSKLSGRAVADEKGNQKPAAPVKSHGSNPYERANMTPGDTVGTKRRTLDDMRKLSELIKRNKQTRD
jgi:hypothetical protein